MDYFEDIEVGTVSECGGHTFHADEIIAFARKFDRQSFHLDADAARLSHFGGLVASGWHTASICMKLFLAHQMKQDAQLRAAGKPVARLGPSPGFEQLKWLKPVYAGDTVSFRATLTGKRPLVSRPQWGMLFLDFEGRNQSDEFVFSYKAKTLSERKPQEQQ